MWLSLTVTVDPASDKWERRRSARRTQPAPAVPSAPVSPSGPVRPVSLDRAFVLWMVIGVPAVVGLVGIVIIAAAFNLRAGYRGARVLLTLFALPSFFGLIGVVVAVLAGQAPVWVVLVVLPSCALVITASVLMWRLDVNEYFHAMRTRS